MIINTFDPNNEYNQRMSTIIKLVLGSTSIDEQISILQQLEQIPKERIDKLLIFSKQSRLFRTGVRIPITNFDAELILLLKKIFSSYYDGIIAPQLSTPFENNNLSHEEIILFDANNLKILDNNKINIETKNIIDIIDGTNTIYESFPLITGGYKKSIFINRNKYFDNQKWLNKTEKKINKNFPNIAIKNDLWNNSYYIIDRHLEYAYFKK